MRGVIVRTLLVCHVAAGIGCAPIRRGPNEEQPSGDSLTRRIDRAHRAETLDDGFRSLAFAVPGFAGLYLDDSGALTVRLTAAGRREQAELVVREYWQRARPQQIEGRSDYPITFRDATLTWLDLDSYRHALIDVLSLAGTTALDADEVCNCVRIGIAKEDPDIRRSVDALVQQVGVPAQAVNVVVVPPVQPMAGLRDGFRPVTGGVRIKAATNFFSFLGFGTVCTATIAATRGATPGFLTNSHCTGTMGGVSLVSFFPAGNPGTLFGADYVGAEIVDPLFTTAPAAVAIGRCPMGQTCRFSDSAFVRLDTPMPGELARIARPASRCGTSACSLDMTNASDRFTVRGIAGATDARLPLGGPGRIIVGTPLEKVGQTSGWTAGTVTSTCVDTPVARTTLTLLCQNNVNALAIPGDSGSPVFILNQNNAVVLEGILWGASEPPAPVSFSYSPMVAVEREIGSLSFFPLTTGPPGPPLTACQRACRAERDACMAAVARPNGPRPGECVGEFRACLRECG